MATRLAIVAEKKPEEGKNLGRSSKKGFRQLPERGRVEITVGGVMIFIEEKCSIRGGGLGLGGSVTKRNKISH